MKKIWLLASVVGLWCGPALAQTMDELLNDGKNTDNVLTLSMGFDRKSYSPLNQINKNNVKRLVPVWSTSLMNDMGELAAPVVHNGVIYAINGKWTFAIDVETGQQIWRTPVQIEPGMTRADRRDQPRRADDLQRQALPRDGRQLHRRARHEDRSGAVDEEIRRLEGRLLLDRRADRRQRRADLRHGRRRIRRRAASSTAGIPRPARSSGVATPFRRRASPARRPGRPTATPGNTAARRPGARAPTIPSSTSSTGAPAMPSPTTRGRVAVCDSLYTRRACSRSGRRPARSSAITSSRRTTSTTWTAPTSSCSPTCRSTARPRKVMIQSNKNGFMYVVDRTNCKLDRRASLHQGQLGNRHRSRHRPAAAHRRLQGLPGRR